MGGPEVTGAWHADGELLAAYHDQRLDTAARWSVEAHLTSCTACRLRRGRWSTRRACGACGRR
jgi:anti-sigma factor RsiW